MKQWLIYILLLVGAPVYGQDATLKKEAPYKQYPGLPAFNVRLLDSLSVFNTFNIPKGKPTLLIYFDPDCKHCKDVTTALLSGMDSLKGIQMYFITSAPSTTKQKKFTDDFHLTNYPNIRLVGRDYEFFMLDYYGIKFAPTLILYDDKKKFVHMFEGGATPAYIYEKAFPTKQ